MNMRDFTHKTGLSAYTLRYYEKIGLISNISRNSSGHRSFSAHDLEWVRFIVRLKETSMPLEEIQEYARLRALGESTLGQRQSLLEQHKEKLQAKIEREQQHLAILEAKIDYYKGLTVT